MIPQTPLYRAALAILIITLCAQSLITSFSSMLRTHRILPAIRDKRICLLIAHPDDEAMFFAPTVLALTRPETGNRVTILSLSSGNAEGLGETRRRELVESALVLGLRGPEDIEVVDNPVYASCLPFCLCFSRRLIHAASNFYRLPRLDDGLLVLREDSLPPPRPIRIRRLVC